MSTLQNSFIFAKMEKKIIFLFYKDKDNVQATAKRNSLQETKGHSQRLNNLNEEKKYISENQELNTCVDLCNSVNIYIDNLVANGSRILCL